MNNDEQFNLEKLKLEKLKLQWEQEKAIADRKFELEKIELENRLNFKDIISGVSIIISVLIVIITLWANDQGQIKQEESDRNLAKLSAEYDFQLKAAEIVMDSDSATETRNKAIALKRLFGDRLPKNFAENFDIKGVGGPNKDKIFDVLAEHPDNRQQILSDWVTLWPGDRNFIQNLTFSQTGIT